MLVGRFSGRRQLSRRVHDPALGRQPTAVRLADALNYAHDGRRLVELADRLGRTEVAVRQRTSKLRADRLEVRQPGGGKLEDQQVWLKERFLTSVRLPAGVMLAYLGDPAAMPAGWRQCPDIAGRFLVATSPAQAGIADVLEKRDGHRDAVERVVVSRVLVEHRGDGDLGRVQRVLEQPPAAPRAVDAALIAGVHEAPARAGIDGQVHADTEQLAL
ncbi:MAG: hypothetical protein OXC31_02350, partial [Spirochaetaceae bacterium]|nr:hypothetical protein [Spirochaetaceae bacterium]